MTQHQQELDRTLRITAEDRQANQVGSLTAAQVSRARRHFAFLAFFIAVFFGGALSILVYDPVSRGSWMGAILALLVLLSGWLLVRYLQMIYQTKPGFPVQVVEGILSRFGAGKSGHGRSRRYCLRIGDRAFDVDPSLWALAREGDVYKAYFIQVRERFPLHLVALEEVLGKK